MTFFKLNFSICSDLFSFSVFFSSSLIWCTYFLKSWLQLWSRGANGLLKPHILNSVKSKLWNYLLSLSFLHLLATKPMAKQSKASSLSVSTTPITAMGCRQCLPLSVVQLKGKHCRKPHCRNGVVDTFGHRYVTLAYSLNRWGVAQF